MFIRLAGKPHKILPCSAGSIVEFKCNVARLSVGQCLRFWEKFALVGAGNPVKNAFVNVAKRCLTAPATSVACERMFSGASNILEEKRAKLDPERLNRILFVRQNFVMSNCTLDY